MPVWMGTGALVAAKKSRGNVGLTGRTKATTARYLGDFINLSGTKSTIIQKRIAASNTGFYAYAGVSRNINFRSLSLFSLNMVRNALLSGLEVCVFTKGEMDKLQTHPDAGQTKPGAVKGDDNKTSVPSRWVRAQLGLWTVESTLRYRRLGCFHFMASQQFRHDLVWAVLFGKFEWEAVAEIDVHGHTTEKALPYVN